MGGERSKRVEVDRARFISEKKKTPATATVKRERKKASL